MKTAAYDFILPFFLAADTLRPAMCQIHGDANGFVYATNAHIVIKVPAASCLMQYEAVEKYPNAEKVISGYDFDKKATIKTSEVINILTAYKWLRSCNSTMCEKCNGEGVIECEHCGEEHDCKDCHGKGDITKGIANLSLLSTEDYYQVVKIAGKIFKADFIHILTICAMALNVDKITVLYNENLYDPHIFEVGDARILIMPRTESEDDFIREIKVKQIN
jgi:hypothetical protein